MSDLFLEIFAQRIPMIHAWWMKAAGELTEKELAQSFGPFSPPMGWHVWHIARWADRLQASLFPRRGSSVHPAEPHRSLWERENLAAQWHLDPKTLGTFEEGSGMSFEDAAALPGKIGRKILLDYAERVFALANGAVARLRPEDLLWIRRGIMDYEVRDGKIFPLPEKETPVAADLIFHISHASRHLGMLEALRGLLQRRGTVSV